MYKLLEKEYVTDESIMFKIHAPNIAKVCKAGQFVILMGKETSERIPLTLSDWNSEDGWIKVVFQLVGAGTYRLSDFKVGDELEAVAGPLGHPTSVKNAGYTVVVGGGLGIAIATPVARAFKKAGNSVDVIIGARKEKLLFNEEEIKSFADNLYVCTDDGSKGRKGYVTEELKKQIKAGKDYKTCFVVGPPLMMKFISKITKEQQNPIKTIASLNTIMLDGTGMCGACRTTVGGETKLVCVDGPDFDAHKVDWEEMAQRMTAYKEEERIAMEKYRKKKKKA